MVATAALTSGGRLEGRRRTPGAGDRGDRRARRSARPAILIAVGAFEATPRAAIPTAGILIGGAMTATTLTGRRLLEGLGSDADAIEARLSLGDRIRDALAPTVRQAIKTGLVPAIDQTRNVGIVTLPGTFVGLVLGGASPAEAARIQLTVLLTLLAVELLERDRDRRADRAHPDRPGRAAARRCRACRLSGLDARRATTSTTRTTSSAFLLRVADRSRPPAGQAGAQRERAARGARSSPRSTPPATPSSPATPARSTPTSPTTARTACAPTISSTRPPNASPG